MGTSPSLSLHREGKGLAVLKMVQSSQAHWWQALQGRGSFRGGDEETGASLFTAWRSLSPCGKQSGPQVADNDVEQRPGRHFRAPKPEWGRRAGLSVCLVMLCTEHRAEPSLSGVRQTTVSISTKNRLLLEPEPRVHGPLSGL